MRARTSSAVQPTPFEHLQLICYYREFTSEHAMLLVQGTVNTRSVEFYIINLHLIS